MGTDAASVPLIVLNLVVEAAAVAAMSAVRCSGDTATRFIGIYCSLSCSLELRMT